MREMRNVHEKMTHRSQNGESYRNVQVLRAFAVLLVIVGHSIAFLPNDSGLRGYMGSFAFAGVDVFFVISGFIIALVGARASQREGNRFSRAWSFLQRRLVRIYPLF